MKVPVLYRKAAEQGNADAQCYLANLHFKGQGVPEKIKEDALWWQKTAEQGDAGA